ncbi:putative O-acetyltransferase CAS1 [Fusarium austroafricanum]|uniref:Putative O-acetyltransferase CAS1 n=1 Tax=Fusarium austroafricanum TaxID=2364996 RepID=A0A8H4NZJ7_9HYPO|nr:putative O-acetyltransferase CAS1 [Fusarium austroafricanum]
MSGSSHTRAFAARFLPVVFCLVLFSSLSVHNLFSSEDPYRCRALLGESERNGSWIHAPDETGARKPFTNWQPDGCMLHHYSAQDIKDCIGDRHMVFSGDSTTRQIFWGMARLLDRDRAKESHKKAKPHRSYNTTFNGVRMLHIWNPYFNTSQGFPLREQLERFSEKKHKETKKAEVDNDEDEKWHEKHHGSDPGLIMLGAGSWYAMAYFANQSEARFEKAFDNITDILQLGDLPKFGTNPMDPVDGIGNEVFVAPVAPPYYAELPAARTGPKGIHKGEVEAIDSFIYSQEEKHNLRLLRAFPQLSINQPEAMVDRTETGFHVINSVAEIKANILLNLRCNAKLDRLNGYPYTRTCCTDYGYGSRPWTQLVVLGVIAIYAFACICYEGINLVSSIEVKWLDIKVGMFAVALLYCFAADRTQLFAKGMKEFVPTEFYLLIGICGIIAFLTIRKTKFRAPRLPGAEAPTTTTKEDAGILSRDQTEEWKGWMQAAILIYHWTGAIKNLPVYIFIRLLVAAYLFQTGYGHTIYFLAKKDFSFRRIASVMLRLNILSCALPYVMGTDYMFYYFAPLVSFWFMVVYATMAICSGFNDSVKIVTSKIFASFVLVTVILNFTPALKWIFAILDVIFRIKWNLHEWTFRVTLDGVIVFVGMLAGVVQQRVERDSSWYTNYKAAIIPSIMAVLGYTYLCTYFGRPVYVMFHPIISIVPILAFIALRNANSSMRNYYSTATAWLGRCSLETFILQFHVFLAGDTKGLLLLDIFKGDGSLLNDRWRDLAIIVPIFIWISHLVAEASGKIVKLIMGESKPKEAIQNDEEDDNELKIIEPVWQNMPMLNSVHLDRARDFAKSVTTGLHLRIAAILGVMWLLNWLW